MLIGINEQIRNYSAIKNIEKCREREEKEGAVETIPMALTTVFS